MAVAVHAARPLARYPHLASPTAVGEGLKKLLPYVGPAFIVSVGYTDPGNWATDLEGGSRFGYSLLWVLLAANLMALLLQHLSAKLGLATGQTYPQFCRSCFSRPLTIF